MYLLQLLLLCCAVSFDGLAAGFSYGIRSLRLPLLSLVIISFASAQVMALGMLLGWAVSRYMAMYFSHLLGAIILMALGSLVVWQGILDRKNNRGKKHTYKRKKDSFIQFIKKLIRQPEEADLDHSGSINSREAFFLGLALASDAFGAGVGIGLAGFNLWLTSLLVGCSKFCLIILGLFWGQLSRGKIPLFPAQLIAGLILILLGLFNIL
ncbi:MAG: sporulation membrane protein YtaF [Bacillota bacterium]